MTIRNRALFVTLGLATLAVVRLGANIPPQGNRPWPEAMRARTEENPQFFTYESALQPLVRQLQVNRIQATNAGTLASTLLPVSVKGQRAIPVLPVKFSNITANPIDTKKLQEQLFGSWPTGSMADFYKEMSYTAFTVTGTVSSWTTLKRTGSFYQGPDVSNGKPCFGFCKGAELPQLIKEALDAQSSIDWGQYDNDGADNKPNSGDDNGVVDFVAFVQPNIGGECNVEANRNIWSHRSALSRWGVARYTTKSKKHGGGAIQINDYVIMPSLACDGKTMIQIGVFAHEFGHAFGLPDLYDTSNQFQGAGNWCLMSGGSWGGDGNSPEQPSHMSAWAKSMLGWLSPALVDKDLVNQAIVPVVNNAVAFKVPISAEEYYLLENRQRLKNDARLPGSGLLIWKISDRVIDVKEATNEINADVTNKGVAPIEAGGHELDITFKNGGNRGDGNDPFPGTELVRRFDTSTTPKTLKRAFCDITESGGIVTLTIKFNSNLCAPATLTVAPGQTTSPASPKPAPAPTPPQPPGGSAFADVAANPAAFLGRTVTLEGAVQNIGTNYFRDLRLVLRGAGGRDLPVGRTPLPVETPPGRLESANAPTLSSVLGRPAIIVGVVRRDPNDPERFVLDINDVKIKQ